MYRRNKYQFKNINEYEYYWNGNYGAKGEKREKREKASPEQIAKQNERNKANRIRRLILANFKPEEDLWITLTYRKEERPDPEIAKKNLTKFFRKMRDDYKRNDTEMKFICTTAIGKKGAIHHHIIINRIRGKTGTDQLISKHWTHGGKHMKLLFEDGAFKELAEYIAQQTETELGEVAPVQRKSRVSTSRNLIRPEPEVKTYFRRTMKKIIEEGPRPTDGYYIPKESIVMGKNRTTGKSYLKYTEIRIVPKGHRRN